MVCIGHVMDTQQETDCMHEVLHMSSIVLSRPDTCKEYTELAFHNKSHYAVLNEEQISHRLPPGDLWGCHMHFLCRSSPVSFPCSVQETDEAADFPLSPSPPAGASVSQIALQHLVRRGGKTRSCCRSSALLMECRAGITCTVITYRLWMFQLQGIEGGAMTGPDPPGAANGSCPWWWRFRHQSRVKRGVGPSQQEGAPLWGRSSSLLCQRCSAWRHQVCARWGWVEQWFSVGRGQHAEKMQEPLVTHWAITKCYCIENINILVASTV